MMNKDEAVQTLSKIGRVSVAYAEDLYDSFFPNPVIPYYIADYLEKVKSEGDYNVVGAVNEAPEGKVRDWLILENVNTFAKAWVNGYKVRKEARYTVRLKGVDGYGAHLNQNLYNQEWFFASNNEIKGYRTKHTRKELESNGFGWVFNCEGIEIEEVE